MGLIGLLDAGRDFWAQQDSVVLAMSSDRHSRVQAAQYRQLAETARATWAQAEIQHASFQLLDIQCRQLKEINGTLSATFDLLENTNAQLAGISGQLAETNEHLKGLRATQDEHLLLIKKERTLKEVVFQLGGLIDSATDQNDAVSAFAYHRYSLATLDRYQLGTADLSALEDKKEFDRFIKNSRSVVRNALDETIRSLEDFEATHLLYHKRLEVGVVHDIPRKRRLPVFTPSCPPRHSPPVFVERDRPGPRSLARERDQLNEQKPCLQLPATPVGCVSDGPIKGRTPPQPPDALLLPKGYAPPSCENIPTQAETDARFPVRPLWAAIAYPKESLARRYEASLRSWKTLMDSYMAWKTACEEARVKHEEAMAPWLLANARLEEEERHIMAVEYPQVLQQFEAAEQERRAAYDLERGEYEQTIAVSRSEFEAAEKRRFDAYLAEWRGIRDANAKLEERLQQAVMNYENAIAAYGRLINEYLDEHSDLQVFYRKVNPVADLTNYRRDWRSEAFGRDAAAPDAPVYPGVDWTQAEERIEKEPAEQVSVPDESSGTQNGDAAPAPVTTLRDYMIHIKLTTKRGGEAKCPVCKEKLPTVRLLAHLKKKHPQEADQPASKYGFFPITPQSS